MFVCCEIIGWIHEGVTRSVVKEYNQGGHNCAQYPCHVTRPEINFLHRQCRDVLQTDEIIPAKATVSPGCDPCRRPQKKYVFLTEMSQFIQPYRVALSNYIRPTRRHIYPHKHANYVFQHTTENRLDP